MPYALFTRPFAFAAGLALFSTTAFAGGYGGSAHGYSPVAPQEAKAILGYADYYRDGNFVVTHREGAGAEVSTSGNGESAYGYGTSQTDIQTPAGATSWKRSVQHASSSATTGSPSATGFTASFVKVRTNDGKYYIFKGLASTGASAGPGGTSSSRYGLAKSAGGRY